jgi:DNA repair protein RadC
MEKKPHYLGHRQRLKDKLLKNPESPADYELLELLLGQVLSRCDTKPIAKELLEEFKSLGGVLNASDERLQKIKGVGPGVLTSFKLLREIWTRIAEEPIFSNEELSSPEAVARAAMARIGNLSIEQFWVALVNTRNKVICWEMISRGTVDKTAVFPREIVAMALKYGASGVILAHNHPGGDPTPSRNDIVRTQEISAACKSLDIRLMDHIVVTKDRYYSFMEAGRI